MATSPAPTDIIYEMTPPAAVGGAWTSRILLSFDASAHVGQLGLSPSGHLFSTTSPVGDVCNAVNCTVFELVPGKGQGPWSKTIIHNFAGDMLGSPPSNAYGSPFNPSGYELSFASGGAIYGAITPSPTVGHANSTIYRLTPPANGQTAWTETALYTFEGTPNPFVAGTPLYVSGNGTVYGTAYGGKTLAGGLEQSISFKITSP